ncbi:MAG: hypothetical protein QME75_00455 [Deltaproteobacteria bacterium]|nr:hypothetical protein [Deltaproteobacteria bacterium]
MPWGKHHCLFGNGRHALKALIDFGQTTRNWRRLWIPSYFCQTVVSSLLSTGIEICTYIDSPGYYEPNFDNLEFKKGDILFLVNYFGLRDKFFVDDTHRNLIEIVEDHTHDPWSDWAYTSSADWCVVSLRKTLPVPDGAVLWSPVGHQLPSTVGITSAHKVAVMEKFTAMVIKGLYLNNYSVMKEAFRNLAISGEEKFDNQGMISGASELTMNILPTFPVKIWRERRYLNHQTLSTVLAKLPWVEILQPKSNKLSVCPFGASLIFDSPERQLRVRSLLISSNVYPSILWPLDQPRTEGIPPENIDFSQRMLFLHCDMRYDKSDMEYISNLIHRFGEQSKIS